MPAEIEITDVDITHASNILLPVGEKFDEERVAFIKNLSTIDLQAVPGSGKTTALLAKLLILERRLPFEDGSGVLVISHTNAAVEEIKETIGKYCPRLFLYPNFVGTIQSFVDQFLAIPYCVNKFGARPYRIDDEIYNQNARDFFHRLQPSRIKTWLETKHNPEEFFLNLRFDKELNIVDQINGDIVLKSKNASPTYKAIRNIKWNWIKSGFLHFDDAYVLADLYIDSYPKVIKFLQKRFRYVFVDEMQDMDKHQHDLLECVFYEDGSSISKYQRVGDKNQAIYNGSAKLDEIWSERETLAINGSHRLTPAVAEIVNCFALHRDANFHVTGHRDAEIPPCLIVYDDEKITAVIKKFSEVVSGMLESGQIPKSQANKYKAIAWRKDTKDGEKIGLSNYYPAFNTQMHKSSIDYSYLEDYLYVNPSSGNSLAPISANIVNALLKILRLEDVKTDSGRYFTKGLLFACLRDQHEAFLAVLKQNLYNWSIDIAKGKDVTKRIRDFLPDFLALFEETINLSKDFIDSGREIELDDVEKKTEINPNIVNYHGFDIEIRTVHAEKGKTHTATLYMETYYYQDGRGANAKSYESQRLSEQFKGSKLTGGEGDRVKKSAKVMYVGISRPTHLLCIAVHKDRFDRCLADIDGNKWRIEIL